MTITETMTITLLNKENLLIEYSRNVADKSTTHNDDVLSNVRDARYFAEKTTLAAILDIAMERGDGGRSKVWRSVLLATDDNNKRFINQVVGHPSVLVI
ncbi:unnamed protein product [Anisakis simplex]|uniref:Response regulator n=1 Tax=Anisakis simplex TaxID=6269 RepID=A0A0M3JV63_ANISI|nr:unnamed protein product [Anisakis simplex]